MSIATTIEELEAGLQAPFLPEDIEWRAQRTGTKKGKVWVIAIPYITSRAIMKRLDEVCGLGNWKNEYRELKDGGFLCGLSILLPAPHSYQRRWVTKWDGADKTQIEQIKGGISGALKRAGVPWGIGRYLYELTATFGMISDHGKYNGKIKGKNNEDDIYFSWNPPSLPKWALPDGYDRPKAIQSQVEKDTELPVVPVNGLVTENQLKQIKSLLFRKGLGDDYVTDHFCINELKELPFNELNNALEYIRDYQEPDDIDI